MGDLREVLWATEPKDVDVDLAAARASADAIIRRRRLTQVAVSVVMVVAVVTVGLIAGGSGPVAVVDDPSLDLLDGSCEQVDAAVRRGRVDVPLGLGIQDAIEQGLVDGWSLAGPVWQLPHDSRHSEGPVWFTAAPLTGPGTAAIAVWVGPDRDATWAAPLGADPALRPEQTYLFAIDDLARRAAVWGADDELGYGDAGLADGAHVRVAACAASTANWPAGRGRPVAPSPAATSTTTGPDTAVELRRPEIRVLAASAAYGNSAQNRIVRDTESLASAWQVGDIAGTAPTLPDGFVGVVLIPADMPSTCRSTEDVLGVDIVGNAAVVLLDPDGEFLRPCPGPPGAAAPTAFAIAIPVDRASDINTADYRFDDESSGE